MFSEALELVLSFEGGYSNNENDPGGETNFGISKKAYPHLDIKNLTLEQAKEIYKQDYWFKIKGDNLPSGLSMIMLDTAVNHGVHKAIVLLQKSLDVKADGIMGPVTMAAIIDQDAGLTIYNLAMYRLGEYQAKNWEHFGKGWSKRILSVGMLSMNYYVGASEAVPKIMN